jgi:hypothetical protein
MESSFMLGAQASSPAPFVTYQLEFTRGVCFALRADVQARTPALPALGLTYSSSYLAE